ncbi:MAG: TonB-dependent receptor, partial [Acidobacteriaceae bacterium]
MTYRVYKLFLLFLLGAFFTAGAFAQNANSTIQGTVEDISGAVVSGATVNLTNVGTGQTLTATSKANGFYTFTNLSPANYRLSVTAQGFAQWVGVDTLRVSAADEIDPKLNAASVTTKVTVQDVTPVIDRVNGTISDVKNATAIETIPVANRNILNVLAFSPGVVAGGYGGSGSGNTRINGMPAGSVDFLVDGQTMTNRNTNELEQNPQPTPTFQEVKIITSNGDAQYDRPAIVELVTKSGTNHFHGQIFELNQNNHLEARVKHSGPSIPFLQHNEYGFQVGGPVWFPKIYNGRDKTFFFFDAERIQQNSNTVVDYIVPTQSERQGNLSDIFAGSGGTTPIPITIYDPNSTAAGVNGPYTRTAFTGNIIPANRLNPVTQKVLGVTPVAGLSPLPLPNITNPDIWQYTPNYIPPASKTTVDNKLYTVKVDQLFGRNRLAARYFYGDSKQLHPETYAPEEPDEAEKGGHNGSLSFTEVISPRAINVAHIGIQFNNHVHSGPIPVPNVSSLLGLPTYQTPLYWPQFYFDSYTGTDNYWTGIDRDNPKDYPDQTINASDQFSYNRGNHQMIFGFDAGNTRIITEETGQPGGDNGINGYYTAQQDTAKGPDNYVADTGSGLADFLLGDSGGLFVNYYPIYHTRQSQFDGYANDDWRVTQKLTLNVGLRYEYWTAFADAGGESATFDPNVAGGMMIYQGSGAVPSLINPTEYAAWQTAGLPIESAAAAHYPLSLYNMPKNNFEPRFGFAYQLNGKTVLRGGYGIYHFPLPIISWQSAVRINAPWSYSASYYPDQVVGGDGTAAELEFPIAATQYGGPVGVNQFMLGSQNCTGEPAGTCAGSGYSINPANAAGSIESITSFNARFLDPNYKPGIVQEYNLTLARELPFHTGFQLSYIGNHSNNLLMVDPLNSLIPRDSCAADGSTDIAACTAGTALYRRMYPKFSNPVAEYRYNGYGNTNELQAQVTHTWGNGLTLQTYFTWMRALSTSEIGNSNGST